MSKELFGYIKLKLRDSDSYNLINVKHINQIDVPSDNDIIVRKSQPQGMYIVMQVNRDWQNYQIGSLDELIDLIEGS